MKLSKDLLNRLDKEQTPFFYFSTEKVLFNYKKIHDQLPGSSIFYAVKANNEPEIIDALNQVGSGFEVASIYELEMLVSRGVDANRIIFSAPVKIPSHIIKSIDLGVRRFAFDSVDELKKIADAKNNVTNIEVYLRLDVKNTGSEFPLSEKFGASYEDALPLLRYAKKRGLIPVGLMFHVGSQCLNIDNWKNAIDISYLVSQKAKEEGIVIKVLDIGGGLPVHYTKPVPELKKISKLINKTMKKTFGDSVDLWIEPGRAMVGDAGVLVTSVIGKAVRHDKEWLYVDTSAFHGLIETIQKIDGFGYEIKTKRKSSRKPYVVSGQTCDSGDTMFREAFLPSLKVGDRLYIMNTGAYSRVYASNFCGFPPPRSIV